MSINETKIYAGIIPTANMPRHRKTVLVKNCFTGKLVIGFNITTRRTRAIMEKATTDS